MTKSVLITGAAGFVGRHITKKCTDLGWNVVAVDNLVSDSSLPINEWHPSLKPSIGSVMFRTMDCREFFKFSNEVFDYVFHCAARVGGKGFIVSSPIEVAEDFSIDSDMFNWACRTRQNKLVLFSSSAAYPTEYQTRENQVKLSENMLDVSKNVLGGFDDVYGLVKVVSEHLAKFAYQKYGIKSCIFRPFSGYGFDQAKSYPFSNLLNEVQNMKEEKVKVWATGEAVRDFIYIDDLVNGVFQIMDKINNADVVNMGSGVGTSFRELIYRMSDAMGKKKPEIVPQLDKPEGVFYRVADIMKMNSMGFYPQWSLDEAIRDSLRKIKI